MELDGLLSALEERANTARTIFMLLDSDADGLVAIEQVRAAGGRRLWGPFTSCRRVACVTPL